MSFALLLLLAAQTPPDDPASEIVVIARRFEGIQVTVGKDARGHFTCGLSQSSGSVRLDERLCKASAKCVAKGAGSNEAVRVCIDRRKPGLLADFRREWQSGGGR